MSAASTNAVVTVDEELWFGNLGDDKELEDRAAQSMAAVAARVLGAKPFPAAARKLEELTRSQGTKIEQVVGVLESDPGLSMRLLRLVNSAGYALRVRCTSVRHAAALVGMRRLHQLATTAAVLDLFETGNPQIKSLLNHAAVVGAFCRYLAVHVDLAPDELFTCGFLHDIGKLMLIDAEGAPYLELVEKAGESPDLLHLLEQETYGFDHAVLGAHVLKNWRIPNPVPRVVAWHHNVARAYQADPAIAAMVQALRLADQLSYLVRTHPEADGILAAAQSPAASYLGVSEAQLSSMWGDLTRLSQRINAQPGGAEEIIPREDSIPPSMRPKSKKSRAPGASAAPPASIAPESTAGPSTEVPKHFTCVVCNKASFGNRCPVCSGHVCSKHQVGAEQWCTECASAYSLDVGSNAFPLWERLTAAGIVFGAGLLSLLVAVLAGRPVVGALLGSVLLSSLCVLIVLVGRRFWLKRSFLRTRAQATAADERLLPLGLTMPPEPSISLLSEGSIAMRPTERINPAQSSAGLPALFSFAPGGSVPPQPVAVTPRHASVPASESIPAPASVPAFVPAVLSAHAAKARASVPTAPVSAREPFMPAPSALPSHEPSAAPPAPATASPPTELAPPNLVRSPSAPPDTTGWRPVERTEPAMPPSPAPPTELRRLAETLPSIPPRSAPSLPARPPSVPPEHAAAKAEAPAPLRLVTEPVPPTPSAAPAAPDSGPVSGEMAERSSVSASIASELPSASEHSSEHAQSFIAATCNAVEPSLLVACRPSSIKPRHYACSPSAGR